MTTVDGTGRIHVVPGGAKVHQLSLACWCKPELIRNEARADRLVVVHWKDRQP